MPTEQQELTLRVTLDDEASPQLAQIRQVLGGLGGTVGSGGVVKHTVAGVDELSEVLGKLGREALGVGRTAMELAKILGPVPIALGTLAYQLNRTSEATKSWGEQMQATANAARMAGIGIGEFRGIVEGLRRSGISAEAATSMIVRFTQAYGELMRVGSQRRQQLLQIAGPEFAGNMMKAIQLIGTLKTDTEKLNYIRTIGENVYKNELARSNDQMLAAYKRNEVLLLFNTPELVAVRGRLEESDKTTQENMAAEAEAMQKLNEAQAEEEGARTRIADILKSNIAPLETMLTQGLTFVEKLLVAGGELQEKFKRENENDPNWYRRGAATWGADIPGLMNQPAMPWYSGFHLPRLQRGGIVTEATYGIVGEAGPEAVIPLNQMDQLLAGGEKETEGTDAHTRELARLTKNVTELLSDNGRALRAALCTEPIKMAKGGVIKGPTRVLVGEAGREAIVNKHGTRIVDKPTVTTLGTDGTDRVVPLDQGGNKQSAGGGTKQTVGDTKQGTVNNPTGVPNQFEEDIKTLAKGGAKDVDIHEYLKARGVNLSIPTCAQFLSVVTAEHGGRIPLPDPKTGEPRYALASNWNEIGDPGYSEDPRAINFAVKQGVPIGQGDSHVTVPIPQRDAQGNITGFLGYGVNQEAHGTQRGILSEHRITLGDKKGQFAIRHQIPDTESHDAAFAFPPDIGGPIPAMAEGGMVVGPGGVPRPPSFGDNRPGPGRVPIPHTKEQMAEWQKYYTNPLADIEQEMQAARSTARQDIAEIGKQGGLGGNVLQAGKAAFSTLQYGLSPISAVEHTTLGRLAGGAVGGREAGNVVADVVSPFIPYTPSGGAASAIEGATKVAQMLRAANLSQTTLARIGLGAKATEAARQIYLGAGGGAGGGGATGDGSADIGSPMGETMDRSVLDRAMGNQMLKVGTSGQMKIVHENAPAGTSVETDGDIFDGAEKQTTHMPAHEQEPQRFNAPNRPTRRFWQEEAHPDGGNVTGGIRG